MNRQDLDALKESLDVEDILNVIQSFYPDIPYLETSFGLILPTICHNADPSDGSMKLYYYSNTHLFHCYTQCQSSFDIYELVQKISDNLGLGFEFPTILARITNNVKVAFQWFEVDDAYTSVLPKYEVRKTTVVLPQYDEKILNMFNSTYRPIEWLKDHITPWSMERYNIRYSIANNQIIIPHYDVDGILVGIRVRNLNPWDIEMGKYMPARIEGKMYSHPLSANLYGIHRTNKAITKQKTAYLFEGEKSVLLMDGWYSDDSVAVATCGNKINKLQLQLLQRLSVQNIVLCYDRMNEDAAHDSVYFAQLYDMCREYKNYFNFSFIYDSEGLIGYKAAPVDYGREIFEYLLRKRVIIR